MGCLNENITWAFCVFRTIAIRLVLNCGLFSRILGLLSFLVGFFNSWRWTKLAMLQYFCWFEMAYCCKSKFFCLFYSIRKTNVETATLKILFWSYWVGLFWKHASVATFVQKVGLIIYQMVYFSEVWRYENFRLKLNLAMDKPDNGVAVATVVQKVGLINFADGLFLWSLKTWKPCA